MLYDASNPTPLSTQVVLQLLALLYLRLERERRKRPPAELGKLGEGFDPGETQRVKLWLLLEHETRSGDNKRRTMAETPSMTMRMMQLRTKNMVNVTTT